MKKNKSAYKGIDVNNIDSSPVYFLGKLCWSVIRFIFMLEMAFVILYPIFYMLSMSFRSSADMYDMSIVWIPKHFTMENFKLVFSTLDFGVAFKNTAIISIVCTILQILVCAVTGYGFARFKFKGSKLLFLAVIFTIIVPPQMINIPNYLLFSDFDIFGIIGLITGGKANINMLDNYGTMFLLAALGQGLRSGVFILIFCQFFKGIPKELEEAAMIDGCGYLKTYLKIMLPNAEGPIVTTAIFSMVWYWNDFYTMSTFFTKVRTLSVNLSGLTQSLSSIMSNDAYNPYKVLTIQQAACIVCLLPIFILFVVLQRRFSQSMISSGLVG